MLPLSVEEFESRTNDDVYFLCNKKFTYDGDHYHFTVKFRWCSSQVENELQLWPNKESSRGHF